MCAVEFRPIKQNRLFAAGLRYDQVDWNDWNSVVDAFKRKMDGWYIEPIDILSQHGNYSFAYLSLCCTLVDTLSQYFHGREQSARLDFLAYVDTLFPGFNTALSAPINFSFGRQNITVTTFSDALYFGFRCGIIHEAHSKLFTRIWGTGISVQEDLIYTTFADGSPCPTVTLDPGLFRDRLKVVYSDYLQTLRAPPAAGIDPRPNFKKKFLHSYGIDIGNEPV